MQKSLIALILSALPASAEPTVEHLVTYIWDRPEHYFGGWSAIEVADGGKNFVAIGDNAQTYEGEFVRDVDTITDVVRRPVGALTDVDGVEFFRKDVEDANDSEGLAVLSDGRMAVSFERKHRILIYDQSGQAEHVDLPREVWGVSENGGVEALATDANDRLIAIPESVPDGVPGFPIWRLEESGWTTLGHIAHSQGFRPVGADVAPDGTLFVLERAFHAIGFQNRVRAFDLDAISPEGTLIWTAPLRAFDNLEGLSVWQDDTGAVRLTMISDDNNLFLQETQIVEFRLTE